MIGTRVIIRGRFGSSSRTADAMPLLHGTDALAKMMFC